MINATAVGILDFGMAHNGEDAPVVVEHTIRAAQRADTLGFGRYWLAEHQEGACCWASPELVLALIARETTRIRVGSGGLLLATHNALRAASDYSLLAQLFPDRIDIGLARGTPGDNVHALIEPLRDFPGSVDDFAGKLVALISYLNGIPRPQHAYFRARAFPTPKRPPSIWLLGTGGGSSVLAAQYGLPLAHSLFHNSSTSLATLATYAQEFRPSAWLSGPRTMIAIAGVCAETRARARAIAALGTFPKLTLNVVGTAGDWCDRVAEIVSVAGADEIMYLDVSPLPEQRLLAYELLSDALKTSAVVPSA